MKTYHKIQTIYKRNPETKFKTLLEGDFSLPEFEYLKNNYWIFTEKVDGTNIRIMFDGETIKFNGKTDNAQLHADLIQRLSNIFSSQLNLFKDSFVAPEGEQTAVCFYGEGYGAGIQKGGCYKQNKDFVLFDIKIGDWWLQRKDIEEIALKFGIDIVPIVGEGTLLDAVQETHVGMTSTWGNFIMEGLVLRPKTELKTRNGKRIITKIKHKDFN